MTDRKNCGEAKRPTAAAENSARAGSARPARLLGESNPSDTSSGPWLPSREGRNPAESPADLRTKAIATAGNAWSAALRKLMGDPSSTFGLHRVGFVWGQFDNDFADDDLKDLPQRFERDFIYLEFLGSAADGPTGITFATLVKRRPVLFENCELWAFNREARVEIMSVSHRFRADDENRLVKKPNLLDEMRARRVELAHKRWEVLAAELAKSELPASKTIGKRTGPQAAGATDTPAGG